MNCTVKLHWDGEAGVWVATSDDIPGLALESGSCDVLIERLKYVVPEIASLNNIKAPYYDLSYVFERRDRVRAV